MLKRLLFSLALPLALAPLDVFAQPGDIIVTASRGPGGVGAERYGGSASLISAERLAERQLRDLSDALRDAPGVAVARSGPTGGLTQVRIRGAEANHTLVLIDGVEVSDPFQGEFDFAGAGIDPGGRLEVLRGAQSALYGSDAIGGVVHLLTPSGAEAPGVTGIVEAGDFATRSAGVRAGGAWGAVDAALTLSARESEGQDASGRSGEADGAGARVAAAKLGWGAGPVRLRAVGRYAATEADTDPLDPVTFARPVDGREDRYRQIGRYGLIGGEAVALDGRWTHDLSAQVADVERRTRSAPSLFDDGRFDTDGRREKLSYVTRFAVTPAQAATLAFDHERETFQTVDAAGPVGSRRRTTNRGYVLQHRLEAGPASLALAARHDDNDRFADATTYRAEARLALPAGFALRAAGGSGVKNPTNFELFGFDPSSFLGNPNLKPERSEGGELGLAFARGGLALDVVGFAARLEDEIATRFLPGFVATPVNLAQDSTQTGLELAAAAALPLGLRLDAAYAYLEAEEDGAEEIRRPRHSANATLAWRARGGGAGAFLSARHVGESQDLDFASFPAARVTLPAYTLLSLGGEVRLGDGPATAFARVENALDEAAVAVLGYASPGRAGYFGLRAAF